MKRAAILIVSLFVSPLFMSLQKPDEWVVLLDKNLTQWENYLSYEHKPDYNGKIPTDASGKPIEPIGYNKDDTHVFSVLNEPGGPVLRISGEKYGCLFTRQSYSNYHLTLQVKWGTRKYEPRITKLRDSGILYHSIGKAGAEYWRSWMLSQEFQIMEGHMGDFWCQANSAIDIRSFQSEGVMNRVADEKQPYGTFKSGSDGFCMRSANYESPAGEWTRLDLICFEGKSLHIVNGHVVMVLKDSRYTQPNGPDVPMTRGQIQLQSEAAEVFYRDIRIKPLAALPKEYVALF
ncbi:3-keto-disaccharide hydrolase [Fibrella aquatica]|uniref:3-keto-disaccharide hydrolase n=1 Tax=Fibrella aquatica TaxID=3242487 RepID=UPI00352177E2